MKLSGIQILTSYDAVAPDFGEDVVQAVLELGFQVRVDGKWVDVEAEDVRMISRSDK